MCSSAICHAIVAESLAQNEPSLCATSSVANDLSRDNAVTIGTQAKPGISSCLVMRHSLSSGGIASQVTTNALRDRGKDRPPLLPDEVGVALSMRNGTQRDLFSYEQARRSAEGAPAVDRAARILS